MNRETRLMGIDYGHKRTGVALSDPLGIIASPLEVVVSTPKKQALARLAALVSEQEVGQIVVGLPTDSEGELGQQARIVIRWARQLAEVVGVPVVMWDESHSTQDAVQHARRKKRGHELDAIAAAVILQSYLEARRTADEPGQPIQAFENDDA